LLRDVPGTTEWRDWSETPAGPLQIGWLPNVRLAPQMCYENQTVRQFVMHWTTDVLGREIKRQYDRLVAAGKPELFAGVIAGWESNLADGYCSLSHLGFSAQRPPADFDHAREQVLQRHIEDWAKGIYDAQIPKDRIFTHVSPIGERAYQELVARVPLERIRQIPQSAAFRAYWTAFNRYSNP